MKSLQVQSDAVKGPDNLQYLEFKRVTWLVSPQSKTPRDLQPVHSTPLFQVQVVILA